jgi:CRP-like cAMP-binding protein
MSNRDEEAPLKDGGKYTPRRKAKAGIAERMGAFEQNNSGDSMDEDGVRARTHSISSCDSIEFMLSPKKVVNSGLANRVKMFELGNSSDSSLNFIDKISESRLKETKHLKEICGGTVISIITKFNDQVKAQEEAFKLAIQEKQARKTRYRANLKLGPKKGITAKKKKFVATKGKQSTGSAAVFRNVYAPPVKVDPKTFKAPKNLGRPSLVERELIEKAMNQSVLFQNNTEKQNESLLQAFQRVKYSPGEVIEEDSDSFYVVDEGKVDLQVDGVKVGSAKAGEAFGELDLLYNRGSTTLAASKDEDATQVFRLDPVVYREIVQAESKQEKVDKLALLQKIPFMNNLLFRGDKSKHKETLDRLVSIMKPIDFKAGEKFVDGGAADTLYAVADGNIQLTSDKNQNFGLGAGSHIGKKALMGAGGKEPNVTSIKGLSDGKVYSIDKADVDKVLGKNFFSRETSRLEDSQRLVRRTLAKGPRRSLFPLCACGMSYV